MPPPVVLGTATSNTAIVQRWRHFGDARAPAQSFIRSIEAYCVEQEGGLK